MRKRKITTKTAKKYREKRADPVGKIVRRHLETIIQTSGLSEDEIMDRLKKYGKNYSKVEALKLMVYRSTLNLRSFVRLLLALNITTYTLDINEIEAEEVKEYEKLMK